MRIVIPGGSGQVGAVLARAFHERGHAVTVLSRRVQSTPWKTVAWDGKSAGEWVRELDGADAVINLAGRSVNCRYHAANRREILESRVESTRAVGEAIAMTRQPPPVWINASTATIYRHALDRAMDEATGDLGGNEPNAPSTWRFSIDVATRWEEAFFAATTPKTRKVAIRSAMTMSPDRGGVFAAFSNLARTGLGGSLAGGGHYVSWIHDADFVSAVELLLRDERFEGAVNVSSPNPLPQRDFMRLLRESWGIPIGLPAAAWMVEIGALVLRTESELVLKSRRVVPGRLLDAGFGFAFPDWEAAARDLVRRWRVARG